MRVASRFSTLLLLLASFLAPVLMTGCAQNRYYRANDPYYHDTHRWNRDEDAAYRRWEAERHIEHREYRERQEAEQREYWEWRHAHPDRDHDHDRDHDRH